MPRQEHPLTVDKIQVSYVEWGRGISGEPFALPLVMRRILERFGAWMTGGDRRKATDLVLIVRRGMRAEYYSFCAMLATTNRVPIMFDRRVSDRRRSNEPYWGLERRRGADRRTGAPKTWTESQFALARIHTEGAPLFLPERLPEIENNGLELPSGRQAAELRDTAGA